MPSSVQTSTIDRRRFLLGLAAASTAAATALDAKAASGENPRLTQLAAELPAISNEYQTRRDAYEAMEKRWNNATPWAPDELTALGTAWPHKETVRQPGETELKVLGGFLWRKGDEFPRRIIVKSWKVGGDLLRAKRRLRAAKKAGNLADHLLAEDEVKRLTALRKVALDYEDDFLECRAAAQAEHKFLYPPMDAARDAFEIHVAAIMEEADLTMEGLVIKAQALAEWDSVHSGRHDMNKVAFMHGAHWHGQIAASILRHAGGMST